MEPRFEPSQIGDLEKRYWGHLTDKEKAREEKIINDAAPAFTERGKLTRDELILVCRWKSPRSTHYAQDEGNDDNFVGQVTSIALGQGTSERLRIQVLRILEGVEWPTASAILHFAFPDRYPILDFRALWSLQKDEPKSYTFEFWKCYADFCREYARNHNVSMRTLDRALWTYSRANQ